MKTILLMFFASCIFLSSCSKSSTKPVKDTGLVSFFGLVTKPEVTSFQYGTHVITSVNISYALRSSTVNLDAYLNKKVTVKGTKISGYPVDGGPEFLDVTSVE